MTKNPTCTLTRSLYWHPGDTCHEYNKTVFKQWAIDCKAISTWEHQKKNRWGNSEYHFSAKFDVEDYIKRLRDGGEDAESIAFYLRSERPRPPESFSASHYHIWKAWRERAVRDFFDLYRSAVPDNVEIDYSDPSDPHHIYRYPDDIAPAFIAFISEVEKQSEWPPSDRCAQKNDFGESHYRQLLDKARDAITAAITARTKDADHATA